MPGFVSVKEAVFPFAKFPGVDIVLGPEMRSTGEVMGIAADFAAAFAKSQLGGQQPPADGGDDLRERRRARPRGDRADRRGPGGDGLRPDGHRRHRRRAGRPRASASRPSARSTRAAPTCSTTWPTAPSTLIVNTPSGKGARTDEGRIRAVAVSHGVPCITTLAGARAAVAALERLRRGTLDVYALQDLLKRS